MFLDTRLGARPRWFLNRPKDWKMRVPEIVRECVVFLGRVVRKGATEEHKFRGTGFLVSVPSETRNANFFYLVTAKHVAEQLSLGDFFITVNSQGGGTITVNGDRGARWVFHPTESDSVDAAALPFDFPDNTRASYVDLSLFLTDDLARERNIGGICLAGPVQAGPCPTA
jgi:hypothetical protein